ncbi:ABC transporter ATP-binding protein/permease [Legionella sp. W05-934-2]|jgi:putative ATP-binding cassette transporter|uniref:ABC transporter ATP-binding protein/permease n=1 Tax=Legionella sp. W05-934-2 TaxID=1198649 RepID=UPI0034618CBC
MTQTNKSSWKALYSLLKDYFVNSNEKMKVWLLLAGISICVVVASILIIAFGWWSVAFFSALTAKALIPFLYSLLQFSLLVTGIVSVYTIQQYLIGKLSISWRNWLTKKMLSDFFDGENNFFDLKHFSKDIDNISQRLQEDIKVFVDQTLNLGTSLLQSILTLGFSVGTLWVVGGSLTFAVLGLNVVIPGFLVWVALLSAILATAATYWIGKSLSSTNQKSERLEAEFRQNLSQVNENSDNIAEEKGIEYFKTIINKNINNINENAHEKLSTQTKLTAFQNFYFNISNILPNLLAAPLYFSGALEVGQLMQIGVLFTQVNMSFSFLVQFYDTLADYKNKMLRITELEEACKKDGLAVNAKSIQYKTRPKESIKISNLSIMTPKQSNADYLLKNVTIELKPGERVLIQGPSGIGKSSLFKVISGAWRYGCGKVAMPANKSFFFLPQNPTIPNDTLKGVLAYPEPESTYTNDEYQHALISLGGMEPFVVRLNEFNNWSTVLSGGQKQKVSIARALLKKPDWLFLDESTSALDEKSEEKAYEAINNLNHTSVVSIAHRSTVTKYHSKILFFNSSDGGNIEIKEQTVLSPPTH